jgi:hypothetical protein
LTRAPLVLLLLLALLLLPAGGAAGQPAPSAIGVQSGDWARVEAGALVLEGPGSYRALLDELAERSRRFLPALERSLGVTPAGPITMVIIPPDPSPYPEVVRLDRAAPKWAAGFALSSWRIGGLRVARADTYPFGDPAGVLAHEVAHFLIHDAGGEGVPRWFNEGVATREQRRWSLRDTLVYSSNLAVGPLPSLRQMDRAFAGSASEARLAYAASFDFVDWATDEYGEDLVRRVLAGSRSRGFDAAWAEVAGVSLRESEAEWRDTSLALFRWVPLLTGAGGLWMAVTALFLVATWRRRRRTARLYERWEDEEETRRRQDNRGRWVN